ncbi:MAG: response regulator [Pseudolabrys sp.]
MVAVVDNEADAVAQAERAAPDAILMDIRLRDGDGIDAAAAIQAERAVPVIFLSANFDAGNLARIRALEDAAIIRKPFLERQLLAGLARALERPN